MTTPAPDGGQSPSTTSPRPSLTGNTLLRATSDAERNTSPSEPTGNTELDCQVLRQRAFEAVVWGMPAVNTQLMYDQMLKAGGKVGQIIYWGKPLDWHNQTLTPNPDTLYFGSDQGHPPARTRTGCRRTPSAGSS